MGPTSRTLIFVYNADGSFGARLRDVLAKVVSPKSQDCNLCAVTYPLIAMDNTWRTFVRSLPYSVQFLHKDEFRAQYQSRASDPLPAVFVLENGVLLELLSREQINTAHTVQELIVMVKTAIQVL